MILLINKKIKIDIGCGDAPREGYDGLDIRNIQGIKYPNVDARNLPFEDGSVNAIFANHVIEHFTKVEAKKILKEWYRVLEPGGMIELKCPNFFYIASEYLKLNLEENSQRKYDLLGWCYGEQNYEANFHYFAYDPWLLKVFLEEAGFIDVFSRFAMTEQNIFLVAKKDGKDGNTGEVG